MKKRLDRRGIGPTLGVALLLVITIALVSLAGMMLTDSSSDLNDPTPKLSVDFSVTQQEKNVVVKHEGGRTLDIDNIRIRGPGTARFGDAGDDGQFSASEELIIETDSPSEAFEIVYVRDDEDDAVLARAENPLIADLGGVPPQITVSYEDLTVDDSDYDYNDWAFDMKTQITGYFDNDTRHATQLSFEFDPLARGAGYSHDQYIVPDELGSGEYELTVYNGEGTAIREKTAEFDSNTRIFLMDSGDAFDSMDNSKTGKPCVEPDRTAELKLTLDSPAEIPDNPIDADKQHGAGLPFDPVMEPSGNDEKIGIGDPRMVTVPTDWKWPTERTHIADAYENVGPDNAGDGDPPEFETNTWFEQPEDSDNVLDRCQ